MSLIHDALKSMDAPQQSKPVPAARAPAAAPRGRPAWLDGLLAFCVVVGAGAVGWYLWQQMQPAPDAALALPAKAQAAPAPAAPLAPTQAQALADASAPAPAPVPPVPAAPQENAAAVHAAAPAAPGALSQEAAPGTAAQAAPAPTAAQQAASAQKQPAAQQHRPRHVAARHRAPQAQHAAAPAPASEPKVDDTPVELHFARFVTAMRGEQTADAQRELDTLKARLPAGALGLVRAQAWFDLRAGNDAAAARGYRAILDRLPGDEEAAINLASIQSRQLRHEEARATLDAAVRLNPDSTALRAALAQYTPNARK